MRHPSQLKATKRSPKASVRISATHRLPALREEDRNLLRRQLFTELSRGEDTSVEVVEAILRRLQVRPFPGAVLLVQMDALVDPIRTIDDRQSALVRAQLSSLVGDAILDFPASVAEWIGRSRFAAIVSSGPGSTLSMDQVRRFAESVCHRAKRTSQGTLTVGIGTIGHDEGDLARSHREAEEALSFQVFLGNDRAIVPGDVQAFVQSRGSTTNSEPYLVQKERKLRERIIAGDKEAASQALDILLDSIHNEPGLTPNAFKSYLLQMLIVFCRSASRIGADVGVLTTANILHAQAILETDSYPALRGFLHVLVDQVIDATLGRGRTPKSDVILLAKKYIAENYAKSPSLREVANYVHLSPHYFSRLFARENDCGFQDYLNRVRIEAAKDMLRNSPVNTKQASLRVGFRDVSHFVRLFHRSEGTTPAKFARSVGQVKT